MSGQNIVGVKPYWAFMSSLFHFCVFLYFISVYGGDGFSGLQKNHDFFKKIKKIGFI